MRALPALALLLVLPIAPVAAQGGEPCLVEFTGVVRGGIETTSTRIITTPTGAKHSFVSGGVDATCVGQGNRLLADSAEYYQDRGELILINRVRYTDPKMAMQGDRMIYYTNEERLIATGSVRGRTNTGTRFTGPSFEYFRAKPGVRDTPSWRAPGRPFVRMAPQDSGAKRDERPGRAGRAPTAPAAPVRADQPPGERGDSVDLTADVVTSQNDSLVWLSGQVVIERSDMVATGDSATLDQGTGYARLLRTPRIVGRGERPFTMLGVEIDMWSREQKLEQVRSSGEASVESDSLDLKGDTIDLRFKDQLMQRVFTWGGRAIADTPDQHMEADSLDVLMPGQRLSEVHAVGKAVAQSTVDTARIVSEERDWIAGDTIVAHFDTVTAPGDTAQRTRMKQVTASGSARALYQLAPAGGGRGMPNLSYNRGREIVVLFEGGQVDRVDVKDRASGLYLEPIVAPDSTTPRPVKPDSTTARQPKPDPSRDPKRP